MWACRGEGDDAFYTRGRGSAQRLPNGDTLVADSNNGDAHEVTLEGEAMWRLYDPRGDGDRRSTIARLKHALRGED